MGLWQGWRAIIGWPPVAPTASATGTVEPFDLVKSDTELLQILVGCYVDKATGLRIPLPTNAAGSLGGDASAANQVTEIARLTSILAALGATISVRVANGASFDIPRFDSMSFTYVAAGAADDDLIATQVFKLAGSTVLGGTLTYAYVGTTNNILSITQS